MEPETLRKSFILDEASIALPSFVDGQDFDFQKLYQVTKVVTRNLNRVIDRPLRPDLLM